MMISALKITADRIALCGLCRCITFSADNAGYVVTKAAGMIAKYLARSFATLKVVSAPRVMIICLPTSTTRSSLVGLLSRVRLLQHLREHAFARAAQRRGLGLATPFRKRFGAVRAMRCAWPAIRTLTLHVTADVDVSNGHVQLKFNNTGNAGVVFHVYDRLHLDRIPRRYTVEADKSLNDRWDTRTWDAGKYDLEVHGPNGFLRTFKGTTMVSAQAAQPEAKLAYDVRAREVVIKAHNDGKHNVKLTLVANAYRTGGAVTLNLQHGDDVEHHVSVDHSGCWYDLTVSDATSGFERRFAGRMETGRPSVTDPAMATELS
jgi:hypothetical protein